MDADDFLVFFISFIMYFPNLDAFDAFLKEVEQELEYFLIIDEDLKEFGRWLDHVLPDEPQPVEVQELKEEEFIPESDWEEWERFLAGCSDEEQKQPNFQEQCHDMIITTTQAPDSPVCDSKHGVTIPSLKRVLECDPFLRSFQPVPTLVNFLELNICLLVWSIIETRGQILRVDLKGIFNETDGLTSILLEVY